MKIPYSDCFFCGGEVKEQHIVREVWRNGELCLIAGVPIGVCQQCGEKFITPEVARRIDAILDGEASPDHFIQVPSFAYSEV